MRYSGITFLTVGLVLTMVGCTSHTTRCSATDPAAAYSETTTSYQVAMLEFRFQPESLKVLAGDTVTWVNHGKLPHTTTSGENGKPDGRWGSKHLGRGGSFSYVFTEPGTYHYYCVPHRGLGMKGVVVVTSR